MHGDIIFTVNDPKVKDTVASYFRDADAYSQTIEDLSKQIRKIKAEAWSLIYEEMKKEGKKVPVGRVYIYDFKDNRIVDIGPASRRRNIDDDKDFVDEEMLDYDFQQEHIR